MRLSPGGPQRGASWRPHDSVDASDGVAFLCDNPACGVRAFREDGNCPADWAEDNNRRRHLCGRCRRRAERAMGAKR